MIAIVDVENEGVLRRHHRIDNDPAIISAVGHTVSSETWMAISEVNIVLGVAVHGHLKKAITFGICQSFDPRRPG